MNDVLVRAKELIGRPVVTVHGDRVAEVKDVVLGLRQAVLVGFTLRNPGFLGGPRNVSLPWGSVRALGPDAVMIDGPEALGSLAPAASETSEVHPTVAIPVMTDDGQRLGTVADVVLTTGAEPEVVGFEITPEPGPSAHDHPVLVPYDVLVSASEQTVVVPADAARFVHDDLAGFGAAVESFRQSHGGGR